MAKETQEAIFVRFRRDTETDRIEIEFRDSLEGSVYHTEEIKSLSLSKVFEHSQEKGCLPINASFEKDLEEEEPGIIKVYRGSIEAYNRADKELLKRLE